VGKRDCVEGMVVEELRVLHNIQPPQTDQKSGAEEVGVKRCVFGVSVEVMIVDGWVLRSIL
jgi:hypothetical protein